MLRHLYKNVAIFQKASHRDFTNFLGDGSVEDEKERFHEFHLQKSRLDYKTTNLQVEKRFASTLIRFVGLVEDSCLRLAVATCLHMKCGCGLCVIHVLLLRSENFFYFTWGNGREGEKSIIYVREQVERVDKRNAGMESELVV